MAEVLPANFDFKSFDNWFKEEAAKKVIQFVHSLALIMDQVDAEVDKVEELDLGEFVMERMTRDTKAAAYDRIESSIGDLL